MIRHFIQKNLEDEIQITASDECFHHLNNVMRIKIGSKVAFVNKGSFIYELKDKSSDILYFSKVDVEKINPELDKQVDFFVPLLKKDNFELSIQKITELGVTNIIPGITKNSVIKVDEKKFEKKLDRYADIVKNACMQSQRNVIPTISKATRLSDIDLKKYDLVICAYETRKENTLFKIDNKIKQASNILLIVGPEGGFDKSEIDILKNQKVEIVTLGSRILRAETAVISLMSIVSQFVEEYNE